ncbi:trimeric intracellular cation channel family protein [Aquamicrobium sp. LC103]|uniref:trimeric intracellular cation channel family protein n=1 Tax=Aquamicrobium sp. LC103 TaxID=1120658 RepID=UPI00063EA862|nr:trimeric intracellular cation channel family protein [Aquamicrobium sp. LC103]TKT82655.1 trimeric intracellular cation channel family protein [Aquamicrobium sp. LC103]
MNPILLLDYAAVGVFAATGALAASRKQLDIIGFLFLASVTGIGGGTFRDLILDVPVFWVVNTDYIIVCAAVAILVYFTAHLIESRYKLLLWLDAVGIAAYCVFGAYKGLVVTGSATVAVVTGMITATLGGILRDMLSAEPSVLMRPEIYVTATMVGAAVFTILYIAGVPLLAAALVAFAAAFVVRGGALKYGWSFPPYKSRPGRRPEDIA